MARSSASRSGFSQPSGMTAVPELDAAGALRRRGQHGDRRGDAVLQVPVPHPGAVEAELLAQLDDLQRRLVPAPRVGGVEQPDGQEAQLPQWSRHGSILPPACGSPRESHQLGSGPVLQPVQAVEDDVQPELELLLVIAPAQRRVRVVVGDLAQHPDQVRQLPASSAGTSADAPALGSNSSWLNPSARLPSACSEWWTRSCGTRRRASARPARRNSAAPGGSSTTSSRTAAGPSGAAGTPPARPGSAAARRPSPDRARRGRRRR